MGNFSMKMLVGFKTPCIMDKLADFFDDSEDDGCRKYEQEKKMGDLVAKFVEGENYIVVEFDTETQTARVLPV